MTSAAKPAMNRPSLGTAEAVPLSKTERGSLFLPTHRDAMDGAPEPLTDLDHCIDVDEMVFRAKPHTFTAFPSTLENPSSSASATVGCAWIVNIISSTVASNSSAVTASAMISVAYGPIMCTPSTSPNFASATTFTNPSCASRIVAFELPTNGNLPTFTWKPFSFAAASVRPTLAICGSQYVHPGIRVLFTGFAYLPASRAATTSPAIDPECASSGIPPKIGRASCRG